MDPQPPADGDSCHLHGGTVALGDTGLLIIGPSGSGKSGLALTLLAYGAQLVSDDQTALTRIGGRVQAKAPAALVGRIEARGVGILLAEPQPEAYIAAIVDMATPETDRLPPMRHLRLLGCDIPLFHRVDAPHFAPALMQFLKVGRAS